jgi:hypothetical protein
MENPHSSFPKTGLFNGLKASFTKNLSAKRTLSFYDLQGPSAHGKRASGCLDLLRKVPIGRIAPVEFCFPHSSLGMTHLVAPQIEPSGNSLFAHLRLHMLDRLRAADADFHLVLLKAPNNPAAARLDARTESGDIGLAVGERIGARCKNRSGKRQQPEREEASDGALTS